MANRILPAVKRYAVGTEPVREAAKVRYHVYEVGLPFLQLVIEFLVLDHVFRTSSPDTCTNI